MLAATACGDGGGEEKREGGLDADGERREKRYCGREKRWSQQKKREQGGWPRSSARKEPTRRALRRWSETEGQREEAVMAGGSATTGRKKAVLAMEEAMMMNEDGDGFTEVEGEVERDRREGKESEGSGGDHGRGGGTKEGTEEASAVVGRLRWRRSTVVVMEKEVVAERGRWSWRGRGRRLEERKEGVVLVVRKQRGGGKMPVAARISSEAHDCGGDRERRSRRGLRRSKAMRRGRAEGRGKKTTKRRGRRRAGEVGRRRERGALGAVLHPAQLRARERCVPRVVARAHVALSGHTDVTSIPSNHPLYVTSSFLTGSYYITYSGIELYFMPNSQTQLN